MTSQVCECSKRCIANYNVLFYLNMNNCDFLIHILFIVVTELEKCKDVLKKICERISDVFRTRWPDMLGHPTLYEEVTIASYLSEISF